MDETRPTTVWKLANPTWMFRACPADFNEFGPSVCPGLLWMPGMIALLSLHVATVLAVWYGWSVGGGWVLVALLPVAVLWGMLGAADVRFRRQRPTKWERRGFDVAVVNWFGFVSMVPMTVAVLAGTLVVIVLWST